MDQFTLRQVLFLCVVCLHSVSNGIIHGFPSILIPASMDPDARDVISTLYDGALISASYTISGILGFMILSPIFQFFGRKPVLFTMNALIIIGWIMLYFANSVTLLMLGRLVQGLTMGGLYIVAMMIGEYSDKRKRGYFMAIQKVSLAVGFLICHSLGLVIGWRQLVIIGAVTTILSIILLVPCPESPAFLAMKGRFDESRDSFYWLFGNSQEHKKELEELIFAQRKQLEVKEQKKTILRTDFLRPFFIVVLSTIALEAGGTYSLRFNISFITHLVVELIENPYIAMYCASGFDIMLIIAFSISCIVIKFYKRRTILFRLGSITVILLFLISFTSSFRFGSYIGLSKSAITWITEFLIILSSFITHVALVPVAYTINAEVLPLEIRGLVFLTTGILFSVFDSINLKVAYEMIQKNGIGDIFAVYGACVLFSLVILYFILPETKDKTLPEIECEIRGITSTSDKTDVELNLLQNVRE